MASTARRDAAPAARAVLRSLVERYDREVADPGQEIVRIRLDVGDGEAWDAIVDGHARFEPAGDRPPDATLKADARTWRAIAEDVRGGMKAFEKGRLLVRGNLHIGVGFLAATAGDDRPERLRFSSVRTRSGRISILQAGAGPGPPIVCVHGLGATKASFLPTVAALAGAHRVIALDLPGFGDSGKPFAARYDARFFAESVVELLDALGLERAHVAGNSLGGRVALELGLHAPERVDRLVLLAPSMAWRRARPYAPLLRLVRPELGAIQPVPRRVVDAAVQRFVPGASDGWTAAGVDEFMRAYMTPRGRAAFYAAARQIYLEAPEGPKGFWPRLRELSRPSLFVWGRQDRLVPIAFARHVTDAIPAAQHLELNCGHVPQLERPRETHAAMARFLSAGR
jgi:pimeloyl-ACP methyl ester carboxylesterase/putative sterol carrier protein